MADRSKAEVWEEWVSQTVLADIRAAETPDPVPMVDDTGDELDRSDAYDDYRLGRGSGDYLYLLYLLDEPASAPTDIVPVYIGESGNVAGRLLQHVRRLREAIPIDDWDDDGSWGSYGKYDHIATVYDQAESPLYAWIVETSDIDAGPYGYPTYRHELEAKLVGLAHSHPRFNRVFTNRDFVPNRIPHEMGNVGPEWVDLDVDRPNAEAKMAVDGAGNTASGASKAALWEEWVAATIHRDIQDEAVPDPIPLFETGDDRTVTLTRSGSSTVLKRSAAIDAQIRQEASRCVHSMGVKSDSPDGLLYVMYQLDAADPSPADIVPRYIGKAEAYGKKNELSANFTEIAKERDGTRQFARWGDGGYWHIGELSDTVFGRGSKKGSWASELFKDGTHQLEAETYLWVRAWDPEEYPGPYGYPAYLAEAEGLLIGLAYDAYPDRLLNHDGVPDDAPVKQREFEFTAIDDPLTLG